MGGLMNPEIKKRWLAALRSGEYKQGRAKLRTRDTYCCMGVLCDVLKDDVNGKWTDDEEFKTKYASRALFPPKQIHDLAGFDVSSNAVFQAEQVRSITGKGISTKGSVGFASLNDTFELSFDEIADIIEAYL